MKVTQSCHSLRPHGLYSPWNSLGQNNWSGQPFLLQGIFQTQGSNPGLLHCSRILYQLSHKGSPRILEWVAIPSPADLLDLEIKPGSPALQTDSLPTELSQKPKSSQSRSQIHVLCIGRQIFNNWITREVPIYLFLCLLSVNQIFPLQCNIHDYNGLCFIP